MAQLVKCLATKAEEPELRSLDLGSLLKRVRFPSTEEKKKQVEGTPRNKVSV